MKRLIVVLAIIMMVVAMHAYEVRISGYRYDKSVSTDEDGTTIETYMYIGSEFADAFNDISDGFDVYVNFDEPWYVGELGPLPLGLIYRGYSLSSGKVAMVAAGELNNQLMFFVMLYK